MKNYRPSRLALAIAACSTLTPASFAQTVLEEVVVVAQKRAQNLQDVPIAVTAYSGEQLQQAVVQDVFDIQSSTPSLRVNQGTGNSSASFAIRGVGTSSFNSGLESSVGLYVDGVYRSRQSAMIGDMIDLASVEVLRGPQGTLFGKNTPSGAILFNTIAPAHEQDAFLSLTAGNYATINASAAGNWSVVEDVLALRGTVFSSQRDGYVALANLNEDIHDKDRWGVRLQSLYTPTDTLSVRIIADYAEINELCCGGVQLLDNLAARNARNPDGSAVRGTDHIIAELGGTTFSGDRTGQLQAFANFAPQSSAEDGGLSIEATLDISANASITSISGYRQYESFSRSDNDFTDVDILAGTDKQELNAFSQEIRWTYAGDALNLVVGAYYFTQEIDTAATTHIGEHFDTFLSRAEGYDALVGGINTVSALTGGNLVLPAAAGFPAGMEALNTGKQDQTSWALFTQGEYHLADNIVLTIGLRYTKEKKELTSVFSENLNGLAFAQPPQADIGAATTALNQLAAGDFSPLGDPAVIANFNAFSAPGWATGLFVGVSPRDNIQAQLNDEQLTGNLKLSGWITDTTLAYVSYATGYKSGGTNTARIPTGFNPLFDAETPQSFELGLKSEFPEQALRINAAAYYTSVDDFQANAFTGTAFILSNAGELKTWGLETELFWQASEKTAVNLIYAHNVAEYKSFPNGSCWIATPFHTAMPDPGGVGVCDRSGDRLATTPKNLLTIGVKQEFMLTDHIEAYLYGEYSFMSEMILGDNADPLKVQGDYGLLNLRAGITLLNSDIELIAWARNVLDENYIGVTFDTPLQPGKLTSIVGAPRTFGLTFNKRF